MGVSERAAPTRRLRGALRCFVQLRGHVYFGWLRSRLERQPPDCRHGERDHMDWNRSCRSGPRWIGRAAQRSVVCSSRFVCRCWQLYIRSPVTIRRRPGWRHLGRVRPSRSLRGDRLIAERHFLPDDYRLRGSGLLLRVIRGLPASCRYLQQRNLDSRRTGITSGSHQRHARGSVMQHSLDLHRGRQLRKWVQPPSPAGRDGQLGRVDVLHTTTTGRDHAGRPQRRRLHDDLYRGRPRKQLDWHRANRCDLNRPIIPASFADTSSAGG